MLDYDDFEDIPSIFVEKCSVVDKSLADATLCDRFFGWRIDSGKLDSVTLSI